MTRAALTLAVVMAVGVLVLGGPSFTVAQMDVTPAVEAERLAHALNSAAVAGDAAAAESVIKEIMDFIQVPTLGPDFGVGATGADVPPIGLFAAQITIVAKAFVEAKYTALDDLVQAWKAGAIGFTSIGGKDFTAAGVEAVLKKVRREAEDDPDDWGGFVIRLVDELGDREKYPFSLLGLERGTGGQTTQATAGSVQAIGATMAQEAAQAMISGYAQQSQSDMGWDSESLQAQLSSPENMQQMMQGMLDQNMWSIAAPFLEAAQGQNPNLPSAQEIQNMMAKAAEMMGQAAAGQVAGGGDTPPAVAQYMQASQGQIKAAISGDIGASGKANDEVVRANMKMRVAQMQQAAAEEKADVASERDDEPDALRSCNLGVRIAGVDAIEDIAEDDLESMEELLENKEEERKAEEEQERQSTTRMVIQLEDEESSKLMLDPVQIWLISMDLIDAAKPVIGAQGGVR